MIEILSVKQMKEQYWEALLKYETTNQLIIANLLNATNQGNSMLFGIISEGDEAKCYFNNTPPYACCIVDTNPLVNNNSEKYGAELAQYFDDHNIIYYGVNASKSLSDGFVKGAKQALSFDIGMDAMELKEVINYPSVGITSIMEEKDLAELADMYIKFELECLNVVIDKAFAINKFKDLYINDKENVFTFRVDDKIVSMCLTTRALVNGRSINGVYTKKLERGKGYCKAMMSDVSRILLERGNKFCTLYVDKANPISNRAYLRVGYHIVSESFAYKVKKKIKCIVSDLDGTLLYNHGEALFDLTDRNDEAIKKWLANDLKFFVATGRTHSYGVRVLEKYIDPKDVVVCGLNGGVIYDHHEIVRELPIELADAIDITNLVKKHPGEYINFQVQAIDETRFYLDMHDERLPFYMEECKKLGVGKVSAESFESFIANGFKVEVGKLLVITSGLEQSEAMQAIIEKKYSDKYIFTRSSSNYVEINNKAAFKGNFIKYIMDTYHYDRNEIAVIGDSLNDMSMIEEVENSFSMKHGEQALINIAKYVVNDVAECVEVCMKLNSD